MYPEIAQAQLGTQLFPRRCVCSRMHRESASQGSQFMITLPECRHGIFRCFSAPREMQEDMTPIQHLSQKAVSSSDNAGLPKICEEKSDLDVSPALVLC